MHNAKHKLSNQHPNLKTTKISTTWSKLWSSSKSFFIQQNTSKASTRQRREFVVFVRIQQSIVFAIVQLLDCSRRKY